MMDLPEHWHNDWSARDAPIGDRCPNPTIRTTGNAASGAAFRLARWLTGNTADAEDVVQDAYLRAFRYLDTFRGNNFRVWLLTIVRNSFLDWLKDTRSGQQLFQPAPADLDWADPNPSPEAMLLDRVDSETLGTLVAQLPTEYREMRFCARSKACSATLLGRAGPYTCDQVSGNKSPKSLVFSLQDFDEIAGPEIAPCLPPPERT